MHFLPADVRGSNPQPFRRANHITTNTPIKLLKVAQGSGYGAVDRVVASSTRYSRFKPSHRQIYFASSVLNLY